MLSLSENIAKSFREGGYFFWLTLYIELSLHVHVSLCENKWWWWRWWWWWWYSCAASCASQPMGCLLLFFFLNVNSTTVESIVSANNIRLIYNCLLTFTRRAGLSAFSQAYTSTGNEKDPLFSRLMAVFQTFYCFLAFRSEFHVSMLWKLFQEQNENLS